MLNKSTSRSEHVVQSGVTQYPIGFAFQYNGDGTPQIRVTIGDMVAKENVHYVISKDSLDIELISLGENDEWVGSALVIERDIPFVQESDYQVGRISSEQIERDFDLSVMRDQMLAGKNEDLRKHTDNSLATINDRIDEVVADHTNDVGALDNKITALNNSVYKKSEVYTKGETDSKLSNVYTKGETDSKLSNVYTKAETDSKLSSVYKVKGSVSTESALPTNPSVGDVYNVLDTGANYVWSSEGFWDKLGDIVDLSGYATKEDLKNIDLDGYIKKSGDTMTGILTIQAEEDYDPSTPPVGGLAFKSNDSPEGFTNRMRQVGNGFIAIEYLLNGKQYANLVFGDQAVYLVNTKNGTGIPTSLGTTSNRWATVYSTKLNNGADLIVPTEGGTLARLEDLEGLGGGDYLPLAGGTLDPAATIGFVGYTGGTVHTLSVSSVNAIATSGGFQCGKLYPKVPKGTDIGESIYCWRTIYVTKMNNGADLAVPTTGGTIARIEDIDAAVGDISTALTAILGE